MEKHYPTNVQVGPILPKSGKLLLLFFLASKAKFVANN